jgi:hypothetical protein
VLLSLDSLEHIADELKNSGFITATSIDTKGSDAIKGIWNFLSILRYRIQRSVSRISKQSSLPVSET